MRPERSLPGAFPPTPSDRTLTAAQLSPEAIRDIQATGSIPSWMPLTIFAFLFGLSMDHEVFVLSRMREQYDRTARPRPRSCRASAAPAGWSRARR